MRQMRTRWSYRRCAPDDVLADSSANAELVRPSRPTAKKCFDGRRWVSSRPAFLLPVRVLGTLFRCPFLTRLIGLHAALTRDL